ncbi:hypothetical protein AKJ51_01350 [candidate division MSBL1 archaeon SCGC-AAA382A20]|uniref:4Fe-4S ferredoxin-type domain-containing protein n=1 Tax=candidate division MSBL1 archaeon SCGC-AAA382A20 TaxID=1698280 RepID=A0A133VLY4_9EURY|nr:hypothetical protein AKJ51_01350 [candidate division MSBL1 archaeon SCGC-AAA382A20]
MIEDSELKDKFAEWMGIDRKKIDWNSTVDPEKCAGCALCVIGCGRNVFEYDFENEITVVENPYQCKVGCTTCGTYCPTGAISFPKEEYVRKLIEKHGLTEWAREKIFGK